MNAIELLKEEHQKITKLIKELETADNQTGTDPTDTETFNRFHQTLKMHSRIEEEVFYPMVERFEGAQHLIEESYREHHEADHLLERLATMAPKTEEFQLALAELRDSVEYHIEKEEDKIFPMVEKWCKKEELNGMGRRMEEIKNNSQIIAATMRQH